MTGLTKVTPIRDTAAQDVLLDPAPRAKRRRVIVAGSVVLALLAVTAIVTVVRSWSSTSVVIPRERIRVGKVHSGRFVSDVAAQGVIVAAQRPTLFAPVAGTVSFTVRP